MPSDDAPGSVLCLARNCRLVLDFALRSLLLAVLDMSSLAANASAVDREVVLPFTRTIQQKLMLVACLVFGMLSLLAASGISGLYSYRDVVHDLDFGINQAPRQTDLVAAIGVLLEPVLLNPSSAEGARYQQVELEKKLIETERRILVFRRKLVEMPRTELPAGQMPITEALLAQIDQRLERLRVLQRSLSDPDLRVRTSRRLLEELSQLMLVAQQVPEPVEGLTRTLREARGIYRRKLVVAWSTTTVVIVLFLALIRWGWIWIFDPIRKLHQGASRVAKGDFDYRVQLHTRDEMAELADAFNKMTCRFQEIRSDLDRQVSERSQQLVRSERLAGVGFLAAGVAHEINNPLAAVTMAGESLESRVLPLLDGIDPSEAEVIRQYLQMIQTESYRCKQITERLLDFSRGGRDAARLSTDIRLLIYEVVAMVQYLSKYREKKIEFDYPQPCYAEINGPEIKQVVLNLVANGLDAMEPGGVLRITLIEQTDQIHLRFADEGCGMTAETIDHIFEPFFTQKQVGQGTGLGLSISHRIVHQHGGTLSATSAGPGQGSTFSVCLPRSAAQSQVHAA